MKDFCYTGERTREISFPVGGIGAGCVGLSGSGSFVDWEIRNHPDKGAYNATTHIAVKAERDGHVIDARVLAGDRKGNLSGVYEGNRYQWHGFGYGVPTGTLAGLPHFEETEFEGTFPTACVTHRDRHFPGEVKLHAFSSFLPLCSRDSSLPCAFFETEFTNPTENDIVYTALFTLGSFGLTAKSFDGGSVCFGDGKNSLCVMTDENDTHIQRAWQRGEWFEGLSLYWRELNGPGFLPDRAYPNGSESAVLEARKSIKPGGTARIRFVLAWHWPECVNDWEGPHDGEREKDLVWRTYYATRFRSARDAALYAIREYDRLKAGTYAFRDALYDNDLPMYVRDAAGACLSVLVTPVCMRLEDGTFYGWEGANEHGGSCEGTCQHVWNYAYALPMLFPDLAMSVREAEAKWSQWEDGRFSFRIKLPPGRERGWEMPCADGQFGFVLHVLYLYRQTGDRNFLTRMWPAVKKAIAFAWTDSDVRWDPGKTGVLGGRQHHTLDREFFGPSSWLEGFYLAALDAAKEMAKELGEGYDEYEEVYRRGTEYLNRELFNGEYYSQKIDLTDRTLLDGWKVYPNPDWPRVTKPWTLDRYWSDELGEIKFQLGDGCLIDQALAQWHMNLAGLSHPFDRGQLSSALDSIFRYNYMTCAREHFNPCRVFCLDGESGTMICSYPEGHPMQKVPIPYGQEVMSGFEYACAGLMLTEGKTEQALTMIRAVRDRYDGGNRNPWNEIECGSNYARSMAAFALLHAISGFTCDMAKGAIALAAGNDITCPFFTGTGWGTLKRTKKEIVFTLLDGSLNVKEMRVETKSLKRVVIDGRETGFAERDGMIALACKTKVTRGIVIEYTVAERW